MRAHRAPRTRATRAGEERQAARAEHARAGGEDGGDAFAWERALAARAQVARGAGDDGRAQRDVGRRVRGRAEGYGCEESAAASDDARARRTAEELRAERARGRGGVEARRRGRGRRAGEEREEERVERAHRAPRAGRAARTATPRMDERRSVRREGAKKTPVAESRESRGAAPAGPRVPADSRRLYSDRSATVQKPSQGPGRDPRREKRATPPTRIILPAHSRPPPPTHTHTMRQKRASTAAKPAADAAATPSARAPRVDKKARPSTPATSSASGSARSSPWSRSRWWRSRGTPPSRTRTVNQWLYGGIVVAFVGLLFHECRPYKSDARFTFDPEAVAFKKREIAEMEAKAAAKKGK